MGEKVFTDLRKGEKAEEKFEEKNSRKEKKAKKKAEPKPAAWLEGLGDE